MRDLHLLLSCNLLRFSCASAACSTAGVLSSVCFLWAGSESLPPASLPCFHALKLPGSIFMCFKAADACKCKALALLTPFLRCMPFGQAAGCFVSGLLAFWEVDVLRAAVKKGNISLCSCMCCCLQTTTTTTTAAGVETTTITTTMAATEETTTTITTTTAAVEVRAFALPCL